MTHAGMDAKIQVCATKGGTYYCVDGIKSGTLNLGRDDFDTTNFCSASAGSGDYDEAHTHMKLLKTVTASLEGDYLPADTNGQAVIETARDAGSTVWLKFFWDGTNSHLVECYVDSMDISSSVDGVAEVSISLTGTSVWAYA